MPDLNAADLEAAMRIVRAAPARWRDRGRACNAEHLQAQEGDRRQGGPQQVYPAIDALRLVKETATAKFDEAVDASVNLGIDAKKGDQTVRGSVVLPPEPERSCASRCLRGRQGAGRAPRGADLVGMEDLAEQVKAGKIDFDVVIAAPEAMRVVGQLGQILGPRGLMPNPKVGTVTADVAGAVKNARAGQVQFPRRQGGHRAMHDRPRLIHARAAAR